MLCQHTWLFSFQSTTSQLQPSPSSVWPSSSWALCVWWDHVPVKAKDEITFSNLLACFSHLQVSSDKPTTTEIPCSLYILEGKKPPHADTSLSFPGLCAFISLEVMRQSVKRMIESEETAWIEHYYSWSFACACSGFVLLFLTGIALLLLSMPQMPRNPWETCMDAEPEQAE